MLLTHACRRAQIRIEGKQKHLGYFDTAEEAAAAYKAVATLLHGEFFNYGTGN